jgi:hypothetical protein
MNSLRRASRAFLVVVLAVLTLTLGACRRREKLPSGTTTSTATYLVGEKVDVEWNGSWWKAEIVGVNGSLYRVHYTGWASSWDENVTLARIRPATAGAKRGTGK